MFLYPYRFSLTAADVAVDDAYYEYVSLLLHGAGAHGGAVITDDSLNAFTPFNFASVNTSNTQFKWGSSSLTGFGGYLQYTSPKFLLTADFTLEFWLFMSSNVSKTLYVFRDTEASGRAHFGTDALGRMFLNMFGSSDVIFDSTPFPTGSWHHVMFTRTGTTVRYFLDGVKKTDHSVAGTIGNGIGTIQLSYYEDMYRDDERITKGICRQTANFTPPTGPHSPVTPLTYDYFYNNTVFSLHANGLSGTTLFADAGLYNKTLTSFGTPTVSTTQSVFGGSSMFLDGTGDYLRSPNNADFDFSTGDFTIECFIHPLAFGPGDQVIVTRFTAWATAVGFYLGTRAGSPNILIFRAGNTVPISLNGNTPLTLNTWQHVAVTRASGVTRMFIDGVLQTATHSGSVDISSTSQLSIGSGPVSNDENFNGYIDELRITKNVARWTGNYVVPTFQNYDTSGQYDQYYGSVPLLLHGTGSHGSTNIKDSSIVPRTLTLFGNTQISTTSSKFINSAMFFDGTGDYISLDGSSDFAFGTGDFTVEMWVRPTALAGDCCLVDFRPANTNGFYMYFGFDATTIGVFINNAYIMQPNHAMVVNTWYHIAVSRVAGNFRIFINGAQVGSTVANSSNLLNGASRPTIAANGANPAFGNLPGYISDLRITKGVGRYAAGFTPPVRSLPQEVIARPVDQYASSVKLLLRFVGLNASTTVSDTSPVPATVTSVSGAALSTTRAITGHHSSLFLDGSNDHLTTNRTCTIGSGQFTIEAWVRPTAAVTGRLIGAQDSSSTNAYVMFRTEANGSVGMYFRDSSGGGVTSIASAAGLVPMNDTAFTHIAATRNASNLITVWVNGVSVATGTSATSGDGVGTWRIGSHPILPAGGELYTGYVGGIRITEGVCRYTGTFTPPTSF